MPSEPDPSEFEEPVPLPITGELDLHTFRPGEIRELLTEYLRECVARGILEVRVIHGRGTGALKAGVLALLPRIPEVESIAPAAPAHGGEGATWVRLRRLGTAEGSKGLKTPPARMTANPLRVHPPPRPDPGCVATAPSGHIEKGFTGGAPDG